MKKTIYTERDIVDMCNAGITRIEVSDNIVLTALAREQIQKLGMSLEEVDTVAPASPITSANSLSEADLAAQVKARVIARLGTDEFNGLLDQIIPQVLTHLNAQSDSSQSTNPSSQTNRDY